jgi:glutathione synthase/RimK-type ligase-like ATP-grasp enzyme
MAFAELDCRVDVLCPRGHPATLTRAVARTLSYSPLRALHSVQHAIQASAPDLVIPCDDEAAADLQRLFVWTQERDPPSARALQALVERSLGAPGACTLATDRGRLMSIAAEEGVRIPATARVQSTQHLDDFVARHGFPVVLKIDRTWGGQGVAIVHNQEEAHRALVSMTTRRSVAHTVTRMVLDRDPAIFLDQCRRTPRAVIVQSFIGGMPANRAVACWRGEVLAGISVEALHTLRRTGPATVVRMIENDEMTESVHRLVRRLGVSGLWGADFVLDAGTKAAYLIEVNPRATPVCHLVKQDGSSLPATLQGQLAGQSARVLPPTCSDGIVAMFPGEWRRGPASRCLRAHYHDVPWSEPALLRDCLDLPWAERGLAARLWATVRPHWSAWRDRSPGGAHRRSQTPSAGGYGRFSS